MHDKIILILVVGILLLLSIVVAGGIYSSITMQSPIDSEVVTLIKMSITGLIGIVAGYFGGKAKNRE